MDEQQHVSGRALLAAYVSGAGLMGLVTVLSSAPTVTALPALAMVALAGWGWFWVSERRQAARRWRDLFDPEPAVALAALRRWREPFREVDLAGVQWPGAHLRHRDLRGVNFAGANLADAYLNHASLQGADLINAQPTGAFLDRAVCDVQTLLPDGTPWTPGCDLERFCDPYRRDFWSPEYAAGVDDQVDFIASPSFR